MIGDVVSDPRNSGEFNKNRDNGRKPLLENQNVPKQKQQFRDEVITPPKDRKGEQMKKREPVMNKQEVVVKPNKPTLGDSGPGRPAKPRIDHQSKSQQKSDKGTIQKRELPSQQNVSTINDFISTLDRF